MTSGDTLIVAPNGDCQQLFAVSGNELRPVAKLGAWPPELVALISESGFLACCDRNGDTLVAHVSADTTIDDEFSIRTPEGVRIEVIELANHLLFAGGIEITEHSDTEFGYEEHQPWLAWCDVSREQQWHDIELQPPASQFRNKGIDALVVSGSNVVAYDNIIEPLFALVISMPASGVEPSHASTFGLPIHNTYERINGSTYNDKFIATLSSGINHGVSGQYVSIYKHSDPENEICVFAQHSGFDIEPGEFSQWGQLALADSMVLVAAGEAGLGVGDITYEDGIAYDSEFGRVDRVATVDETEDLALLSVNVEGTWSTQMVQIPVEELRANQELALHDAVPNIEKSISGAFNIRIGLARTDILANSEAYRAKYGTTKLAEIASGKVRFPLLEPQPELEKVGAHRARVSIALMLAGIHSDDYFLDDPEIPVDDIDGTTLRKALEHVLAALIDD